MVLEVHRNLNAVCRINRERFRDAVLSGYGVTRSPDKITTDNPIQPITAITTVTTGANTIFFYTIFLPDGQNITFVWDSMFEDICAAEFVFL